jgi:hypothetical protein
MTPVTPAPETGLGFAPFVGGGLGLCFGCALILYNLVALIQVLREPGPEKPSALSMGAWAIAFVSLFLGPCGLFTAFVAFVIGRIESGRIMAEKSPVASSRPIEMATINSLLAMVFTLLTTIMVILTVW